MSRSPYYFDRDVARHAVEFFPRFLRLPSAEWYGRPFHLNKHQRKHIANIFGWRRRDGTRRYRKVRWWEPKRNGKSVLFAGVGHVLTVGDGENLAEIYAIARNLAQASIVPGHAKVMVGLDIDQRTGARGPLASLYEVNKEALFCPHLLAKFMPLAGDPEGKHGLSPHGIIGDEVWGWRNGKLLEHLEKSQGSRAQPLSATCSSSGVINTYGHQVFKESLAIEAQPDLDPECYVVRYGPDPGTEHDVDWTDEDNWAKWNPNFPHSPKRDFLRGLCRDAQRNPRLENEFKQFHCGIWTEQATRWFPMHLWRANTAVPDDPHYWKKLDDQMAGRPALGGVDLASNYDIAAVSWLFPPAQPGERTTILRRFYCPESAVAERDSPLTPYRRWVAEGALIATPGNVTDYDFIETQIKKDAEKFRIKRADPKNDKEWDIAIDRHDATQVTTHLQDDGFKVARYGQEFSNMNAPAKNLEGQFIAGTLEHGNHPVARWMYGNAAYRRDHRGYIKPDKEHAAEKIDGVVADCMANGIAMRWPKRVDLSEWLKNPMIVRG